MQRLELLDRTASLFVSDEVAEFPKNVACIMSASTTMRNIKLTSDPYQGLVTCCRLEMLEHRSSCIRLQIFVVCDELHHTIPDFFSNMIASGGDELEYRVDIPLVLIKCQPIFGFSNKSLTSVANRSVRMAIFNTISSLRL